MAQSWTCSEIDAAVKDCLLASPFNPLLHRHLRAARGGGPRAAPQPRAPTPEVLGQSSAAVQPGKSPFHHPAAGENRKTLASRGLGNDDEIQIQATVAQGRRKFRPRVAAIREQRLQCARDRSPARRPDPVKFQNHKVALLVRLFRPAKISMAACRKWSLTLASWRNPGPGRSRSRKMGFQ